MWWMCGSEKWPEQPLTPWSTADISTWVNHLFDIFSYLSQESFTALHILPICLVRVPSAQEGSVGAQCLQIIHHSCKQKYNNGSLFHNGETLKRLQERGEKWVSDFIDTNSIMTPYKLTVIERHGKEDFFISTTDKVLQVINFTVTHKSCGISLKTYKVWN